ncbi:helix-turn-helix domain-containing protein [Paenibacillus sp. MER 99-2]|uniref:helix-turn-helix domain-containing protein n=1 Tax=Paenibacillus sp. MER 99-2 TaxID=2939572 RepID=UPI00203CCEB6|nr:helix-turn-helix domain-containing protein [Paenibacillus sp. MER 99-2]MCM3170688.1 helix-turn-helix domain-containing protein [Paenibacillus sp. MER 99-2]
MQFHGKKVYVLESIRRLKRLALEGKQHLQTASPWMLVGVTGSGMVHTEHHSYALIPDSAILGEPGTIELQTMKHGGEWEMIWVEIAPLQLMNQPNEAQKRNTWERETDRPTSCYVVHAEELAVLSNRLHTLAIEQIETERGYLEAHILLQQMLLWWMDHREKEQASLLTTDQVMVEVKHFMEDHYMDIITRDELAVQAGITPAYFSVRFKKSFDVTPSIYLDRLRVHRAIELLLEGEHTDLTEIARLSGFSDAWYLSKRFRKMMGISPSAFKHQFVPQLVASLSYPLTHHLFACGVFPQVASFNSMGEEFDEKVRELVAELPRTLSVQAQAEFLAQYAPEIILSYDNEKWQNRLRALAPVVHVPWLSMNWREHMMTLARLFGKESNASEYIQELDNRAAHIRNQLHSRISPDTRISVFKIAHEHCYLYGNRDVGCIFYELLEYEPHPYVRRCLDQNANFHSVEIGMEQMVDFRGQLNVVVLYPGGEEQIDFLRTNAHWRSFEVAVNQSIIFLDHREWLHYDPINIAIQLEKVQSILADQRPLIEQ